jgi:hypothetical protein
MHWTRNSEDRVHYVAISEADRHPDLRYAATIHHGIPRASCCHRLRKARLKHDPEKCAAVFPRDKRGTRLRGDHAQTTTQSAMTIHPNLIALQWQQHVSSSLTRETAWHVPQQA